MAGIISFFRNLFGKESRPANTLICRKVGNEYFVYRKAEGGYQQVDGPFSSCQQCKASSGATECREA